MKKPIKISLIVLCCLLVVAVILYYAEKQNGLLSRIYFGDRITVTIEGIVDGESAQPDSTQVECVDDNGRQEVHHSGSDKYSGRTIEAGSHKLVEYRSLSIPIQGRYNNRNHDIYPYL